MWVSWDPHLCCVWQEVQICQVPASTQITLLLLVVCPANFVVALSRMPGSWKTMRAGIVPRTPSMLVLSFAWWQTVLELRAVGTHLGKWRITMHTCDGSIITSRYRLDVLPLYSPCWCHIYSHQFWIQLWPSPFPILFLSQNLSCWFQHICSV